MKLYAVRDIKDHLAVGFFFAADLDQLADMTSRYQDRIYKSEYAEITMPAGIGWSDPVIRLGDAEPTAKVPIMELMEAERHSLQFDGIFTDLIATIGCLDKDAVASLRWQPLDPRKVRFKRIQAEMLKLAAEADS